TSEPMKSETWVPDSPHLHCLPATPPAEGRYRSPSTVDIALKIQISGTLVTDALDVVAMETSEPVERKTETVAAGVVRINRPAPSFIRKAREDRILEWKMSLAHKETKAQRS